MSRKQSARNAYWTALDYDFDWYVYSFEYSQDWGSNEAPNEHDEKYLQYCELLMQAKEFGLGYQVEWEDTLYLVPTPLIRLDERNRNHSTTQPALYWKDGIEFYYLHGANFEKELWEKVVSGKISPKEVLSMGNIEQRMAALRVIGIEKILETGTIVDSVDKAISGFSEYKLYELKNVFSTIAYYLAYTCVSTGRLYASGIDPKVGSKKDAVAAIAWKFKIDDYERGKPLFDLES